MTFTATKHIINTLAVPAGFLGPLVDLLQRADKQRGGYVTLSVSLPRRPRTTGPQSQNNHAHGHAQQIAEHTGHEVDEVLVCAKARAVKRGYPVDMIGGVAVPWSQARISTVECGHLIDELHQIAAELDVTLREDA